MRAAEWALKLERLVRAQFARHRPDRGRELGPGFRAGTAEHAAPISADLADRCKPAQHPAAPALERQVQDLSFLLPWIDLPGALDGELGLRGEVKCSATRRGEQRAGIFVFRVELQ